MAVPSYADQVPERLRFRVCPMCGGALQNEADLDGEERPRCSSCGWWHYLNNVLGVTVVAEAVDGRVLTITKDDGTIGLIGGVVELGETPEAAAVRETREEGGVEVEPIRELGRWLWNDHPYGPMLCFMLHARIVSGDATSSAEGEAELLHPDAVQISPNRRSSHRAFAAFRSTT